MTTGRIERPLAVSLTRRRVRSTCRHWSGTGELNSVHRLPKPVCFRNTCPRKRGFAVGVTPTPPCREDGPRAVLQVWWERGDLNSHVLASKARPFALRSLSRSGVRYENRTRINRFTACPLSFSVTPPLVVPQGFEPRRTGCKPVMITVSLRDQW